ncbi:MFS transporter [Amycolatopsis sp. YIM 10]|uniref:MFS transporter n=1 Tax=Amycolatopsis sp. YIM 10 TaxID=2653857 RepID=UPI00129061EB|nr:MFS transporter [Amycolatopsis sp. YIM 10]QFU93361.1 enterobactin exporter EntS [Amycolatopsis sp. YIM 10]
MARASYAAVFRVPSFTAMWLSQVVSVAGDQLARVALAVLVFERTGSAGWTAFAWALTFLADLLGGLFLAGLADRYPARAVLIAADLVRAGLVAVMLVPGLSIVALCAAVFAVQLLSAPFSAARASLLVKWLRPLDLHDLGVSVVSTTFQVALLIGLPLGGGLVALLGVPVVLLVDVATFLLSALVIAVGVRADVRMGPVAGMTPWARARAGARLISRQPKLRTLLLLACVAGFYTAPEGLAIPYAEQIGAGAAGAGWLLVANPAGTVVGNLVLARWVPERWRLRLLGPLAIVSCLVLLPSFVAPELWISLLLWTLCGVASAHDMVTQAAFVRETPEELLGQAFGLAGAALRVAQGLGIVATGALAGLTGPAVAIGITAAVGTLAAVLAAGAWRRATASPSAAGT